MLNENQLKILNNPKVQELIKKLDMEPHDPNKDLRRKISNQIDSWFEKLEFKPRVISSESPNSPFSDKSAWIREQIAIQGRFWCPFVLIVAVIASYCVGT